MKFQEITIYFWPLCFLDHDNRNVDEEYKKKRELDKKKWHAADFNEDNMLTKDEYSAYLYPSEYRRMHEVAAEEILKGVDTDRDGYLSLEEYIGNLFVYCIFHSTWVKIMDEFNKLILFSNYPLYDSLLYPA